MFTDTHLADADRKAIHDFALDARDLLMTEARDLLEGVYGLKADGTLAALDRLPNLSGDAEGQETHRRLGQFLADEVKAGLERREAVDKLVKEVAFTHLNRLVAFKMLEARRLIRQAVGKGRDSNGFKFYLADHPDEEALWNSGDAGADAAYRRFLLWQAAQVAREIKVLFDPANLPSRLFPRPAALKDLLELLNADALVPAWTSPETIGWVYQYFNETEKAQVFERLYKKKQKIRREDIPAATQLFTPRWIVRFLVENTLGRTWVQMHPETRLKDKLRYVVPLAGEIPPVPLKLAREITLLDPACGTMHFGLVAFDLFAEMYREELECAGQPGWPATASVGGEVEVPAAILAHNLFGIDIDLRAVQLAALTLYLKAKELNKDAVLTASNLACADVLALNGERLNAFLKEMNFQKPAYERLIRALWMRLKDINQLGSLLRLEEEIADLVAEERARFEREGRQPDLFGERAQFESEAAEAEYWDIVSAQLIQAFDEFARRAAARGADETLFAGEATKGLRMLDLMLRRYDCVTANPPYMGKRNMSATLAGFLDDAYPTTKGDLYAAFIARCAELAVDGGRLGMITQQSFMFLSSYEGLREDLMQRFAIETMAHTGPGAFAEIGGEKVNTTVFALRAEPEKEYHEQASGTYFRLVREEDKQEAFARALVDGSMTYRVRQVEFRAIPGAPWVYWVPPEFRHIFTEFPKLSEVAAPRAGMHGGDRFRFARLWWEVGAARIGFACKGRDDAFKTRKRWFPYMKGGTLLRWYGNQEWVIAFDEPHFEILSNVGNKLPSRQYYFREGITYSAVTSSGFSARISPGGFIFDAGGSSLFPNDLLSTLGILNSTIAQVVLSILNPTVNIQAGDIARIPIPSSPDKDLRGLTQEAVRRAWLISSLSETTYDFRVPPPWRSGLERVSDISQQLASVEARVNSRVNQIYSLSSSATAALEAENLSGAVLDPDNGDPSAIEAEEEPLSQLSREELAVRWVSFTIGILLGRSVPGSYGKLGSAVYRRENFAIGSLPAPDEAEFNELVGPPQQFACVDADGGRHVFAAEVEAKLRALADKDGIVVLDEGHPDDLPAKVEIALELMLGEQGAAEVIAETGGDLRRFLERDFFPKWHVKWYRKRPIYWLLQSPRKLYGLYLFHERLTKDTLFVVQRKYVDAKLNLTRQLLAEKRQAAADAGSARERRTLNKEADEHEKLLADVEEFARRLKAITDRGYDPDINDGVILNMAPLADVIPSWSKEPQKYWEGLEAGDYDWAHIAMKYWPERVREKCRTDKSLAIAHGLA